MWYRYRCCRATNRDALSRQYTMYAKGEGDTYLARERIGQCSQMRLSKIHILSSACGRSFVCFVFGLCLLPGSKTKHKKLLPQADEIRFTQSFLAKRMRSSDFFKPIFITILSPNRQWVREGEKSSKADLPCAPICLLSLARSLVREKGKFLRRVSYHKCSKC